MNSERQDLADTNQGHTSCSSLSALVACGCLSVVGYMAILFLSRDFEPYVPQVERPLLLVLVLFGATFGLYLAALCFAVRIRGQCWRWVFGFSLAFRGCMLFSEPIQEVDIYRYLWDGLVVNQGVSPFAFSPQVVAEAPSMLPAGVVEPTDLQRLVQLRDSSSGVRATLDRVHYRYLPTVYPPVSQAVFAIAAGVTPLDATVATRVRVMKCLLLVFDLATLLIVLVTLGRLGIRQGWAVAYGWCPLVVKEFANSGHLDSIAVCLCAAAVYCSMRGLFPHSTNSKETVSESQQAGSQSSEFRWLAGGAMLLGLAVGAKLYPVALSPLLAWSCMGRLGIAKTLVIASLFLVVTAICLAPMLTPNTGKNPEPFAAVRETQDPQAGLKAFLSHWMMNDLIFLTISENLTPDSLREETIRPWFVVLPNAFREKTCRQGIAAINNLLESRGMAHLEPQRFAFLAARALTALLFAVIAIGFARVAVRAETAERWLELIFLTMAWFWLLLPTLNPWYWTWAMPWIVFARNRVWLGMSGLLFVYYLRFYFESHADLFIGPYQGVAIFDFIVVWFEYVPLFIALVGWRLWRAPSATAA